jgi:hypothetical protein
MSSLNCTSRSRWSDWVVSIQLLRGLQPPYPLADPRGRGASSVTLCRWNLQCTCRYHLKRRVQRLRVRTISRSKGLDVRVFHLRSTTLSKIGPPITGGFLWIFFYIFKFLSLYIYNIPQECHFVKGWRAFFLKKLFTMHKYLVLNDLHPRVSPPRVSLWILATCEHHHSHYKTEVNHCSPSHKPKDGINRS